MGDVDIEEQNIVENAVCVFHIFLDLLFIKF